MPIYEYRCDEGHTFEVMQRMTDDPLTACSTCEAPVQRVFHPVAVHFKGSGFYNTDYGKRRRGRSGDGDDEGAKDSGGDAAGPDGSKPAKSSSDGSTKSDKKPAGESSSKAASGAGSSGGD
jgi:putative FmdB family regulatory protein